MFWTYVFRVRVASGCKGLDEKYLAERVQVWNDNSDPFGRQSNRLALSYQLYPSGKGDEFLATVKAAHPVSMHILAKYLFSGPPDATPTVVDSSSPSLLRPHHIIDQT
jgi:hypothetical protein